MNAASQVRISKVSVKKDKVGQKWATIQLMRAVDESDSYKGVLADALEFMESQEKAQHLKLTEKLGSKNLVFFPAVGVDKPSEMLHNVELGAFKIKREESEERDWLILTYDFTVTLEDARRWLIPSIGDDILCVVEDCQLSFPRE